MSENLVHVAGRGDPLSIRINGHQPTFHLGSEKLEAQCLQPLEPRWKDFMEIAATIFATDGAIRRGGDKRSNMGVDWHRGFAFDIEVRDPEFWSDAGTQDLLAHTCSFLTDDDYSFRFRHRHDEGPDQAILDFDPSGAAFHADHAILFSGGLDSFAGALETLATTDGNVLLVSHRSAPKVARRQETLGAYLAERFRGRVRHLHVKAHRRGDEGKDTTQRSRTLLFAAIGGAVAKAFGARHVDFFENGIVSHNLPISPQVIGTMATRTTHPLSLEWLRELVDRLDPEALNLTNRFEWLTKCEVVSRIAKHDEDDKAKDLIGVAVSCTSVREQATLRTHCGECSQCLDRRFAILAAGLAAHDPPESYAVDILHDPRKTSRARVMGAEWTRQMLRIGELDGHKLLVQHGTEMSRIFMGHPTLPSREVLTLSLAMYRRQSEVVRSVLEREASARIGSDEGLPATSLLAMILNGPSRSASMPFEDDRLAAARAPKLADITEMDQSPQPDDPLEIAFFCEDGVTFVGARGLCTVRGQPAVPAHALKPHFDADRADGQPPCRHRYVQHHKIKSATKMDARALRQNIRRCRRDLEDAYTLVHGSRPASPLLIQSNPNGRGYRLDPAIRVIAKDLFEDG